MLTQDNQSLNLPLQEWILTDTRAGKISCILNPEVTESPHVTFEKHPSNCKIQWFSKCSPWNPGGCLKHLQAFQGLWGEWQGEGAGGWGTGTVSKVLSFHPHPFPQPEQVYFWMLYVLGIETRFHLLNLINSLRTKSWNLLVWPRPLTL